MPDELKPSEVISKAIEILGPNGENWFKGMYTDCHGKYCVLGALGKARGYDDGNLGIPHFLSFNGGSDAYSKAKRLVEAQLPMSGVVLFNDKPDVTFPQVKVAMCRALKAALEEEDAKSK